MPKSKETVDEKGVGSNSSFFGLISERFSPQIGRNAIYIDGINLNKENYFGRVRKGVVRFNSPHEGNKVDFSVNYEELAEMDARIAMVIYFSIDSKDGPKTDNVIFLNGKDIKKIFKPSEK